MAASRLVLVPGFTQTASSWDAVRRSVAATAGEAVEVVPLDVAIAGTFEATALALGEAGGAGVWCGYSMGGRLALRLALERPDLVRVLVLVGASPGLPDAADRAARRAADEELARSAERDGAGAFLERWLAQPLFAGVPPDAPGLADRLTLSGAHLARSLRVCGTGAMEPLWDRLGELKMPVHLVTGAEDEKFGALAQRMAAAIGPSAEHHVVPGGHAVPLEQPHHLARLLTALLGAGGRG